METKEEKKNCDHEYDLLGTYHNSETNTKHRYYQCRKCGHKYTGLEVPKKDFIAFQRFRALVRTHPEDYFDSIDSEEAARAFIGRMNKKKVRVPKKKKK